MGDQPPTRPWSTCIVLGVALQAVAGVLLGVNAHGTFADPAVHRNVAGFIAGAIAGAIGSAVVLVGLIAAGVYLGMRYLDSSSTEEEGDAAVGEDTHIYAPD